MLSKESFVHYEVGDPLLDGQHWDIIQQIMLTVTLAKSKLLCDADIWTLRQMMIQHFDDECTSMRDIHFPFYDFHRQEHDKLLKLCDNILKKLPSTPFPIYALEDLGRSFVNHVDYHDRQYVRFNASMRTGVCIEK